ncbi:MAG: VapC toxin family PIN domain ribonuclease [Gammaproteobacteria bacterium]
MNLVLVDSSVWVAHFRKPNRGLQSLLAADQVLCHPLIVIEIACGTPPSPRERTLRDLKRLRFSTVATIDETLALIEREEIQDAGCAAVDVSLLTSVLLTLDACLWTLDKSLWSLAHRLNVAFV